MASSMVHTLLQNLRVLLKNPNVSRNSPIFQNLGSSERSSNVQLTEKSFKDAPDTLKGLGGHFKGLG